MPVQAVFFDMGGTIETYWQTPELRLQKTPGLQSLLLNAGIHLGLSNVELHDVVMRGLKLYRQSCLESLVELPASRVWREFILPGYPIEPGRLDAAAEALMLYFETHFYQRALRPEMPQVLESLRQLGLKIGLISNVNSRGQVPGNLKKYGIDHYFDPVVLSSEYGFRKPDPAIFHYAARLANTPTSRCAYVGDRINRDILGAKRAGYHLAIQIRHVFAHGEQDEGAVPDACIENMLELVDIVKSRLGQAPPPPQPARQDIRAVLFDAGDILYYRPRRNLKLASFLRELGLDIAHRRLPGVRQDLAFVGAISQQEYRTEILRSYGVTQPAEIERGLQIIAGEDEDLEFFPGVPETLKELKARGYLLGIVTDTAASISAKLRWFERGGFGNVWDTVISSLEIQARKPDPRIYQAALCQLGLAAQQAVFVGHKISELDGARAVGMHTVAFNYEQDAAAEYYIERFGGLLDVPLIVGGIAA